MQRTPRPFCISGTWRSFEVDVEVQAEAYTPFRLIADDDVYDTEWDSLSEGHDRQSCSNKAGLDD
jgi:hypothetical protein